ncbi:hypothetical protein SBA3_4370003 [Candidatus Sulfopaludibacter sp. SbA3]|nr:hypothetical protein SBA3_4370003 [Candidatus Sulfopaludibacter sp. SbA3]
MLSYEHYGYLQGGPLVASLGRTEVARTYMKKALEAAGANAADRPTSSSAAELRGLLIPLGALDVPPSGLAESLAELRRGAGLLARNGVTDGTLAIAAHEYAGRRLTAMGRYTEAIAEHRVALGIAEQFLTAHPDDHAARRSVLDANAGIARARTLAR